MSYLALAILTTSGVTYLLRAIPLVAMRKQIDSRWIRSFLYYVPWAVLTAMTIPAVFFATKSYVSATVGLIVAVGLAFMNRSLFTVVLGAATLVWLVEFAMT
ncbi:branched-chain amino acid transporter [Bowdeniella nasicola]|uniref:Branched-chain amino acid transporter n=1 Tax=Bowdeniella nasicola TaxID=208480 RepID=A0A1Q5Q3M3_9ACTO|nr:AzlD domain-containing protein [Bowdeniella nasicola]OKL54416.1 branched-chain amino acid transporter [Bowdeniella nasicola]